MIVKRIFDILFSIFALAMLILPMCLIALAIKFVDKEPIIHFSLRMGKDNVLFKMPKFRTMSINTPQVATHLIENSTQITKLGSLLRKYSLDELPQFWSVLIGDLSLVGPRPALFNQWDLIEKRKKHGVDKIKPGMTGWAQINGRDNLSIDEKVQKDIEYMNSVGFLFDLKILFKTYSKVIQAKNISH